MNVNGNVIVCNTLILCPRPQICIEDNLLPYPSDTVSFLHDLNYGYQLLKMVRDIETSNERVKRKVNNVIEEFYVVYAKIGPEPVTLQVQASGIPSPRYEWFYRPNDDPNTPSEDFIWTPLSATQDNVLYFDPFTFSDSGYYYCRISHNLCVVAEVTKGKLDDYFTSKKIFLRPERGSLVISRWVLSTASVLCCTGLCYTVLYCTVLYITVLY